MKIGKNIQKKRNIMRRTLPAIYDEHNQISNYIKKPQ